MKITIENFGPISNISYDLEKDLHLIFGKNAIGKSYGAYCIYCLLKNLKEVNSKSFDPRYHYYYDNPNVEKVIEEIYKKFKQAEKNQSLSIDKILKKFFLSEFSTFLLPGIKNSFQNTFKSLDNLKNRYSNKPYKITFSSPSKKVIFEGNNDGSPKINKIDFNKKWDIILKDTKTTKFTLLNQGKKEFGVSTERDFKYEMRRLILKESQNISAFLSCEMGELYFLPASRSGLYQALNAFTPIMAELTQNRFFIQNKKIELPSLPEPLSDYFIDLSTLNKKNVNKEFEKVTSKIEEEILFGKVEYDDETKKIMYIPNGLDLKLDLSEASSMVAELSPIVVFLRHIYNNKFQTEKHFIPYFLMESRKKRKPNKSVIFIEEPEAHLHPEIQVKIVEVFADLVKLGVKVIMTSHSNYILNKINNLILDRKISDSSISAYHLVKSDLGCVINSNMHTSNEGIFDDNFTDITRDLYEERMKILEKNG